MPLILCNRFRPTRSSESSFISVALGAQQRVAGPDHVAILLFERDLDAVRPQQKGQLRESRGHSALARENRSRRGRSFIPRALAVKSSRSKIGLRRGLP